MPPDVALPVAAEEVFANYVRILGRGPGRSRALTREEARDALGMVLRGEADPHQVGAFLMLLRYRGEDPEEVTGLVEAARAACAGPEAPVDLDWPSYGSGRTRDAPWYLLAALALARAGHRVLMHGSNEFTSGTGMVEALPLLGLAPARDRADAARLLEAQGFAYLPLAHLSPGLDRLILLRRLLGLRSPINTVGRLLNPFDAPAGVDGVFHPPYVALHLGAAERLGRGRLLVLKGGGGEAERTPVKPVTTYMLDRVAGRSELELPALSAVRPAGSELGRLWRGEEEDPGAEATVRGTIALGLLALGRAATAAEADAQATELWARRHGGDVAA